MRTVENTTGDEFRDCEKEAIREILDWVQHSNDDEIVSCENQVKQLYVKKNSLNTPQEMKEPLMAVIAQLELMAEDTVQDDPIGWKQKRSEFQNIIALQDNEDAMHIVISWHREAEYFITTDWNSILNVNTSQRIERALESMHHPMLNEAGKRVTICDPKTFLRIIRGAS